MLETEKVFDILPDMVSMYEKLNIKEYSIKKLAEYRKKYPDKNINELQNDLGTDMIMHVLKNSKNAKEEFFRVVACLSGISVDGVKKQSINETFKVFDSILKDDELMSFFSSAMR
jgi:hypothetical protein